MTTTFPGQRAYNLPLYYDILFEPGSDREADFIRKQLEKRAKKLGVTLENQMVYEPFCGSGRLLRRLAQYTGPIRGMDLSKPSVAYCIDECRRAGYLYPHVKVHVGDVTSILATTDLLGQRSHFAGHGGLFAAYCMINSFRELTSGNAAECHLRTVYDWLVPGGIYLLGLHLIPTPENRYKPKPEEWKNERDGVAVESLLQTDSINLRNRIEVVDFDLSVQANGRTFAINDTLTFRTYTREQFTRLVTNVGFRVADHHDFGYTRLRSIEDHQEDVIFTLEKPLEEPDGKAQGSGRARARSGAKEIKAKTGRRHVG
jgi:SAM-dependent methyltransferase